MATGRSDDSNVARNARATTEGTLSGRRCEPMRGFPFLRDELPALRSAFLATVKLHRQRLIVADVDWRAAGSAARRQLGSLRVHLGDRV